MSIISLWVVLMAVSQVASLRDRPRVRASLDLCFPSTSCSSHPVMQDAFARSDSGTRSFLGRRLRSWWRRPWSDRQALFKGLRPRAGPRIRLWLWLRWLDRHDQLYLLYDRFIIANTASPINPAKNAIMDTQFSILVRVSQRLGRGLSFGFCWLTSRAMFSIAISWAR